jgi:hypothetical protein
MEFAGCFSAGAFETKGAKLLTFAAAGSIGLLLRFWLRAPALIAASVVAAVVCLSAAPFTAWRAEIDRLIQEIGR